MRRALCSIDEEAPARVAFCLGGQLRATQPSRAETMLLEVHTLLMQAAARDENGQAVKNLRAIYLAVFGVRRLGDLLVGLLGSASALMLRILLPSLSAFCCSHGCVHGEVLPHWVRCVPARGGPDPEDWGAWAMARQAARVVYAELPVSIVCLAAHWPIVDAPWRLVSDAVVCLPCAPRAASRMHRLHPDVVAAERGLFQRALNEAVFSQHPVPACALRWLVFFYASFRMVNSAWREVLFGSWAPGTAEAFVSALHALHLASEDARSLPLVQSCRLPTQDVAWARSVVPPAWFPVHNHGCGGSPRQFSCWVEGAQIVLAATKKDGAALLLVHTLECPHSTCRLAHAWADEQIRSRWPPLHAALSALWTSVSPRVELRLPRGVHAMLPPVAEEAAGSALHPVPTLLALCVRFSEAP